MNIVIFASLVACAPAQAEKRVALVIGNSAYKSAPKLANPASDAARPLRPGCKLGRSPSVAVNGGGLTEVCD